MGLKHDYKCPAHGFFVSREPVCPHGCTDVQPVFLQAPGMISDHTKVSGKTVRQLAIARPVVHEVRCTYPQCQATNGCVGACSKGQAEKQEPVVGTKTWFEDGKMVTQHLYASDISKERVDETAKREHEWVGLSDEEIWLEYQCLWPFHPAEEPTLAKDIAKFARAIEAKLKEKNHG